MTGTDWKKPHCENCGRQGDDLGVHEGYTACCNETVCPGITPNSFFRGYRFGTPAHNVRACCWAQAREIYRQRGEKVPAGSSRLHN